MISQVKKRAAEKYIRRIRNGHKREYAKTYLAWIESNFADPVPELPLTYLSLLAQQAVRMQLTDLLKESLNGRPD